MTTIKERSNYSLININDSHSTLPSSIILPPNSQSLEKVLENNNYHENFVNSESTTIDDNENKIISTSSGIFHQILVTGAILILAAACGMPIGYSAILLPQLHNQNVTLEEEIIELDIETGSWIASVHSLATPIGSFASGPIADRFGRRPALLLSIFPLIIGWCILALSKSCTFLIIGRIIAGFAVGLIGAPAQILLAEIAIPRIRGILIGAPFVSYSLGILFVYALGSELHWRTVAWCGNILPILSGIAIFLIPESPVWLTRKGQIDQAEKSLNWLRGYSVQAKQELNALITRFENEKNSPLKTNENFIQLCCKKSSIKPLIIINTFHFLQILSGTFLVVFYAVNIMSEFDTEIDTMRAAVITAIVRLICTFIFCFLLLLIKRRYMIIISGIGSGISALALGVFKIINNNTISSTNLLMTNLKNSTNIHINATSLYEQIHQESKSSFNIYFLSICLLCYIAFNTGFMVMPGIMIGELLPAKVRGQIAGYIFALFNISLFVVAKIFPFIQISLKTSGLFIMFAMASFVASIFMFLLLPETKGKTLGEIEDYFNRSNWLWMSREKGLNSVKIKTTNTNI